MDFYRGKLSARRLAVLLRGLPRSSRLMGALAGDGEGRRWSDTDHLLATLSDQLQALVRVSVAHATQGKAKLGKFRPHPRPGQDSRRDASVQRDSLAYQHLRQLAPGGPVARGEPLSGPLTTVARDGAGQRGEGTTWEDRG